MANVANHSVKTAPFGRWMLSDKAPRSASCYNILSDRFRNRSMSAMGTLPSLQITE